MPRKKKIEQPVETPAIVVAEESAEKKEFRAFMESYKRQNPKKYALKEAELTNKLNSL